MSTRAPLDSSEPTSTCTSTGQQAVACHPWAMAIMFGLSSVHHGQVVPADIRPGPVSKSGPIRNFCGAGRGLSEPPWSTPSGPWKRKAQCEDHTRILFGMAPWLLEDRGPSIFFCEIDMRVPSVGDRRRGVGSFSRASCHQSCQRRQLNFVSPVQNWWSFFQEIHNSPFCLAPLELK